MKQAIKLWTGLRRKSRGMSVPAAAFALMLGTLAASSAHADDLDIYVKALSSSGGAPAILFQLDNSGSMRRNTVDTSTATNLLNQRMYRMADIAMGQATGMKSTFKLGLSTYDDDASNNDVNGRIVAPVKVLSGIETITSPYTFALSNEHDDVRQLNPGLAVAATGVVRDDLTLGFGFNTTAATLSRPTITATTGAPYARTWPDADFASLRTTYFPNLVGSAGHEAGLMAALRGNVVFWYRHSTATSNTRVVFKTTGATQNTYMMLTNEAGTAIQLSKQTSTSLPQVANDCAGLAANDTCISFLGSALTNNTWYRVVIGTDTPSVAGNFSFIQTCYNNATATAAANIVTCGGTLGKETAPSVLPNPAYVSRVGLKFARVDIPQGATINSAQVRFKASAASSGGTWTWRAGVESTVDPQPVGNGLFMRTVNWTANQTLNAWSNAETGADTSITLTSQLQTAVNQSGWCGGDAVVLVEPVYPAEAAGVTTPTWDPTRTFTAHAYDNTWPVSEDDFQAPQLVVNWTPTGAAPSGCTDKTIALYVDNSSDDTQQNAGPGHVVDSDEATLTVSNTRKVALRFPLVPLPSGVTVKEAYLDLIPSSTTASPPKITVQVVDSTTATPFDSASGALDGLAVGADMVTWQPATWVAPATTGWAGVTAGNIATSPDLSTLIAPLLAREDWTYDSGIELVLDGTSATALNFYAWERPQTGTATANRAQYGQYAARLRLVVSAADPLSLGQRSHRWVVNSDINALTHAHATPILGTFIESAEYMTGRGGYTIPDLAIGECGTNGIILLTDGEENNGGYSSSHRTAAQAMYDGTATPTTCSTSSTANVWACTYNIARGIYNTGVMVGGNKVSIRTDAIGFGPDVADETSMINGLTGKGGGKTYTALSASALADAFAEIISQVSVPATTIAASGVAVNALNRFEHLDQLYYSLFTPSTTVSWKGNLKRYRLNDSAVQDVKNEDAIDMASTGFFAENSRSYWSDLVDAGSITDGGAASEVLETDRKMYTHLGAAPSELALVQEVVSGAFTNEQLGLASTASSSDRARVVAFMRQTPKGDSTKTWGAAIHNSPRVVTYDTTNANDPVITVFYADNRGILHAIDAGELSSDTTATNLSNTGGVELFSFIPKELLTNAARLEANTDSVTAGYITGLDGDITLYREDNDADGSLDKVSIFMGMRRGGKNYYALDVTEARSDIPAASRDIKYKWMIEGGIPGTDFEEMGQSWSAMSGTYVKIGGDDTPVLVFSGGYDTAYHDDGAFTNLDGVAFKDDPQAGRAIYMVDPETGNLLWKTTDLSTSTFPALAKMKYSIAATPRILDRNGDGIADALYVVDLAGQVFRIELSQAANWGEMVSSVVLVAQFGSTASGANDTADNRRFYEPPSIARVGSDIVIALGSGYREEPRSKTTEEAILLFRDVGAYASASTSNTVITLNSLDDLTSAPADTAADSALPGWYVMLDQSVAEKAIGSPRIFNNIVLFPVWNSQTTDLGCAPDIGRTELGVTDLYGRAIVSGDRFLDIELPGFGDTPQILFQDGSPVVAVGVRIIELPGADPGVDWSRSRWYQIDPD